MVAPLIIFGLVLLCGTPAQGSALPEQGVALGMRAVDYAGPGEKKDLTVNSLKGSKVVDPQGEPLGKIEDVMLSHESNAIAYVVLEPGTRDRLIPIPFSVFRVTTKGRLVLDIDEGLIYTAPNYPKGGSPNWRDPRWDERVAAFWSRLPWRAGIRPSWQGGAHSP